MKTIAALMLSTSLAFAGGLPLEIPAEAPLIVPEGAEQMGGSGAWLIPLMAIALIAIAVNSSDDDPDEPDGCKQDCNPPPECITKSCALIAEFGTDNPREMTDEQREARRDYYRLVDGDTSDWTGFSAWWAAQ